MLQNLFIGIFVSFIGSLPIGALNLNVIDIGLKKSMQQVISFSFGASLAELFQVFISVLIMNWAMKIKTAEMYFDFAALTIFLALTIYYFILNKKEQKSKTLTRKRNEFQWAIFLSLINPLVYPFWIFYAAFFQNMHWIVLESFYTIFFCLGISFGTFIALYLFGFTGQLISQKIPNFARWINGIICITFLCLTSIQLYRILTIYN